MKVKRNRKENMVSEKTEMKEEEPSEEAEGECKKGSDLNLRRRLLPHRNLKRKKKENTEEERQSDEQKWHRSRKSISTIVTGPQRKMPGGLL